MLRRSLRTQITTRVVALSAAVAILLGSALVVLIVAVTAQRDAARVAFRSQQALSLANQLEKSLLSIESALNRYVTTQDQRYQRSARRELAAYPAQTRRLAALVSDDPGQQQRVRTLGEAIRDYDEYWATSLMQIVAEEGFDEARSQVLTNGGRARLDEVRAQFESLFERERAVIRAREEAAERGSARAIGLGVGGLALVIAIGVASTMYLRRAVLRPVRTVAEATGRLAAGDLSTRVPAEREDELGELARGFNSMADSLEQGREELEHTNAELSRSNAELEQFASVTSHDLQAPLTTISMYAELLERRRGDPGADDLDLVDGIRGATQQARALIRDLLEYSRAGRGHLNVEDVAVGPVVEHVLEALAGAIEESGAQVDVGDLPVVRADRANLCRVFQNLIGNALKFTAGDSPHVCIEAERDNGDWRFSVRDNGIGMNPDHAQRIFEPFQRLHGEEDYPGTGIGLAICERIISQLGGRIWVSSTPGEGSVFSFTLPAASPAAQPPRVRASA
ncbi:MAG: HAMP domain-containing protein [Actinobacteria bacterium]|nr:HAMP domain-containing protein [Actinomycetota bacterium]